MNLEVVVNFNVHAAFVSEKLDDVTLFNHPSSALVGEPIR
jgi:hypothetical protein